jgi:hypothetical protein
MKNHDSGLTKEFYKNEKNYKRIAKFKDEAEAEAFAAKLKADSGSIRFEPVIERMRWNLSNQGMLKKLGFTRYKVYVPIMEK